MHLVRDVEVTVLADEEADVVAAQRFPQRGGDRPDLPVLERDDSHAAALRVVDDVGDELLEYVGLARTSSSLEKDAVKLDRARKGVSEHPEGLIGNGGVATSCAGVMIAVVRY